MIASRLPLVICAALLAACARDDDRARSDDAPAAEATAQTAAVTPAERPGTQQAAGAAVAQVGGRLGVTVASLGDPAAGGLWLRTGLVQAVQPGRVVDADSGAEVTLELRPGASGGGGRLSMAGFAALGRSVTELPRLEVFADG